MRASRAGDPEGGPRSPTVRAFLAVAVPPDSHARLVACKRELARTDAAVRWVRDAGLHVTVRFLGGVSEAALEALHAALLGPLGGLAPPQAQVRGLGAFPHWHHPRVLWAGVECAALGAVAATVAAAAVALGLAPDAHPFHAHVTLGRVNGMRNWPSLEPLLRRHAGDDFGAGALRELIALRSDLHPGGALYTKLWAIPFRG